MGDCSDPADHLVWERWQFIDLRIQGGMFVRSSGEGAAKMHVSRFDVLVTLAYVTSTLLWVVVPVGWRKTSTPPCHRPPRIERRDGAHGRTRTAGLLLTKEVLEDDFSIGAPLRSTAEVICNNRCLAALPRESTRRLWKLLEHSELRDLKGGLPAPWRPTWAP